MDKKFLIIAGVGAVLALPCIAVGLVYMLTGGPAMLKVLFADDPAAFEEGSTPASIAFDNCIDDPAAFDWEYPERCADEVGGVARWWANRQDQQRIDDGEDDVLPLSQRMRRDVKFAKLRSVTRYRPDEAQRQQVADELVELAHEFGEQEYPVTQIPRQLHRLGAHDQVVELAQFAGETEIDQVLSSAVMSGDIDRWSALVDIPLHKHRAQVGVAAALCLIDEVEEAERRLRFVQMNRGEIESNQRLRVVTVAYACDIPPEPLGLSAGSGTSHDDFITLAALGGNVGSLEQVLDGISFTNSEGKLLVGALSLLDQEEAEPVDAFGLFGDGQPLSIGFHRYFEDRCTAPGQSRNTSILAPGIIEDSAQRVDELAGEADDDDTVRVHISYLSDEEHGDGQDSMEMELGEALSRIADSLRLEAARQYLEKGQPEMARPLIEELEFPPNSTAQLCLAASRVGVGDSEGALEALTGLAGLGSDDIRAGVATTEIYAHLVGGEPSKAVEAFEKYWLAWQESEREISRSSTVEALAWLGLAAARQADELDRYETLLNEVVGPFEAASISVLEHVDHFRQSDEKLSQRRWDDFDTSQSGVPGPIRAQGYDTQTRYLLLHGSAGSYSTDVWIDAGLEPRFFSVPRSYALSRARAAVLRGDDDSAAKWRERQEMLLERVGEPHQMWLLSQML